MNITLNEAKLAGLVLSKGIHGDPAEGLCLTEAVAYVHDLPHTDDPDCVSLILGAMGRCLNDLLLDDTRQQLIPFIRVLPGTAGDGHDEARSYMTLDWLVRVWLPTWLELSPECRAAAVKVRELDPIVDVESAQQVEPVVRAARDQATAAMNAARATVRAPGRDATWLLTWATAQNIVWAPAWAPAWIAAKATIAAAAEGVTRNTAWSAAAAAVTVIVAGDVAGVAARALLQPTVAALHLSAIELYRRMAVVDSLR